MMISKVKPLHQKVDETTQAVDDAEHKMSTLENKRKALEVRLAGLAKGFEEATIDKNEQEDKTIKMRKMLETAAQLRKVRTPASVIFIAFRKMRVFKMLAFLFLNTLWCDDLLELSWSDNFNESLAIGFG